MSVKNSVKYKLVAKNDDGDDVFDEDDKAKNSGIKNLKIEENGKYRVKKNDSKEDDCSRFRNFFFTLFLLITILISFVIIFSSQMKINKWKDYIFDAFKTNKKPNNDWTMKFDDYGTESCVRLFDIDGDGLDDLMFGISSIDDASGGFGENTNKWDGIEYCGKTDLSKNCKGYVYGMRGYDGKLLWKFSTKSEVFAINCHSIDVNLDGKPDCVAAGRRRTFLAFDPRNGSVFWESHSTALENNWNLYTPVILPVDLDHDGVNEIVVSHGGNPTIPSNIKKREAGRMILYSGKTGKEMGKYLQMPNAKESYMSPVLHVLNDGSIYLLFGSGGETVPGSLYMISLPNYYKFVMEGFSNQADNKIKFKGSYSLDDTLMSKYPEDLFIPGLYNLYDSKSKGVMVPPVLVDINHDNVKDILMTAYDGTLVMFNGATLDVIWKRDYACHETYTSPAPGYFNDDDVPDFMLAQNYGAFDIYKYSILNILDGRDGSVLWEQRSPRMQMISPLTIQTTQKSRDIYFYRIQGVDSNNLGDISHQVYHGLEPQQPVDKPKKPKARRQRFLDKKKNPFENLSVKREDKCPEFETLYDEKHEFYKPECETDKLNSAFLDTYGLLIDRSIEENPLVVFKTGSESVIYNYTLADVKQANNFNTVKFDGNNYGSACIVLEPMERNTGAIADFDGDGIMDIVTIVAKDGLVRNIDNSYLKVIVKMEISKKSLVSVFNKNEKLEKGRDSITIKIKSKPEQTNIKDMKFSKNQTWNSYMGYLADSAFN